MTSSEKFAVPFRINLKTSFILNGALLLMYLGAAYWLWVFDLNLAIKLALLAALMVGFIYHTRRYLLKTGKRSVANLVWLEQDHWQLETTRGETVDANLLGSSFVNPWLVVLNFKPETGGRMWPVVILPDSVDSTTFRRLSVKLRLFGGDAMSDAV
jgi:toxin CptA